MSAEGFYRRPLPESLIPFASDEGRKIFREALDAGGLEGWFALAEQFHTQSDPAFCGLGTLVMVLNALAIDPGRAWKGPWRWFSEELLDCCRPLEVVQKQGITLDQLACLARCNGATAQRVRASESTEDAFRARVREAATTAGEPFLAVAYSRQVLGQTGGGHFSPVAGYHAGRDLALVLDAARFKYPPHWVPVSLLWQAQLPVDPATGRTRGHVVFARSMAAPNPYFCRIALERHDWSTVAQAFNEAVPRVFAAAPPASPEALIATLLRHLPEDLATLLTTYPADAEAALPAGRREAIEVLLAELRSTALFGVVQRALVAGVTSTEGANEDSTGMGCAGTGCTETESTGEGSTGTESTGAGCTGTESIGAGCTGTESTGAGCTGTGTTSEASTVRGGSAELAAMLVLVCPDTVFAGVPAEIRAGTERLRDLKALPPRVRAEVERLRAQILALEDVRIGNG